jgi:hypothetical protein
MTKKMFTLVATFSVLLLIAASSAFAQSPSNDAYQSDGPPTQRTVEDPGGRSLPFTGLDLALVGGAGIVLFGLGLGIRRVTRPSTELT